MLDWKPGRPSADAIELTGRVDDLVASMNGLAFRDGVELTGAADGELIKHGQRGAPRRVIPVVKSDSAGTPSVKVGEVSATHVRLFASAAATVDLTFVL